MNLEAIGRALHARPTACELESRARTILAEWHDHALPGLHTPWGQLHGERTLALHLHLWLAMGQSRSTSLTGPESVRACQQGFIQDEPTLPRMGTPMEPRSFRASERPTHGTVTSTFV